MIFTVTHRFEIEAETTREAIELSKTASPTAYAAMRKTTGNGATPHVNPVDEKDWPMWAKALKFTVAAPQDKGIGDTVARVIGPENSEAFKVWYKKITGKDCGCNGRQKLWNQLYPL